MSINSRENSQNRMKNIEASIYSHLETSNAA